MTLRPRGGVPACALACALAAAVPLVQSPASAAPLARAEAVARALARSPETGAFRAVMADSARLARAAGTSPHAPRFEAESEFRRLDPFDAQVAEFRVGIAREFDTPKVGAARRAVAGAEAAAVTAGARAHERDLARRTDEAFGARLVAARRAALADSAAATARRLAGAGRRAARAEAITAYDLRRLDLDRALREEQARAARGAEAEADATLRALMLVPADEAIEPVDDLAGDPWRCAADSLAAVALERRPDVLEAVAAEELLDAEARLADRESRSGPEVGVFVARHREERAAAADGDVHEGGSGGEFHSETRFGATVSLPLTFLARDTWTQGRVESAALRARAARVRLEAEVPLQVAGACARVAAAQERLALLAGALVHADADRARIEAAYREGRLELEAALAQRERLLEAAAAEVDAFAELESARAALAQATGLTHAELAAALGGAPHGDSR